MTNEHPSPTADDVRTQLLDLDDHLRVAERDLEKEWEVVAAAMEGSTWWTLRYVGGRWFPALRSARDFVVISELATATLAPLDRDGISMELAPIQMPGLPVSIPPITVLAAYARTIHDVSRRVRAERLRIRATWHAHSRAASAPLHGGFDELDDLDALSRTRDQRARATFGRHVARFIVELSAVAAGVGLVAWVATL